MGVLSTHGRGPFPVRGNWAEFASPANPWFDHHRPYPGVRSGLVDGEVAGGAPSTGCSSPTWSRSVIKGTHADQGAIDPEVVRQAAGSRPGLQTGSRRWLCMVPRSVGVLESGRGELRQPARPQPPAGTPRRGMRQMPWDSHRHRQPPRPGRDGQVGCTATQPQRRLRQSSLMWE